MIKLKINNTDVSVPEDSTILEAANAAGIGIPTLCKHPDLESSSACGICVVKIKGAKNKQRACVTPVYEGMEVVTHDPELVGIRRSTLELILSNHPNECLTCARNRTCELQNLAEEFGVRENRLPEIVPELPRDDSTKTIVLEPRKCIKCGRCVTVCQQKQDVWALSFLERGLDTRIAPAGDIDLAESPCVRCGQCSAHCPVGAIYEYDETAKVWEALQDPQKHCVVQIAPAVRVSVGESLGREPGENLTGQIYASLRRMGFDAVFDTNCGADITIMEESAEFVERIENDGSRLPLITTCCPSWVDFMEKYHSDMMEYFSSCKSPHAIVGTLSKTYYAERMGIDPKDVFTVSIMPCTSKKYEITRSSAMFASGLQDVDVSITTREFSRMLRQDGIIIDQQNADEKPDPLMGEYSGAGTIFGATGGVMEAALRTAKSQITGDENAELEFDEIRGLEGVKVMQTRIGEKEIRVAVAHGLGNVEKVLNEVREAIRNEQESPYHFIEVMACPGGCIGGGGQAWKVDDAIRRKRTEGLYADDRRQEVRRSHQNESVKRLYDEFLDAPLSDKAKTLLHTSYTARPEYRK